MSQQQISIQTRDGVCKAWVFTPEGKGPWPGVIFYMDAFGIRPAMIEMANHDHPVYDAKAAERGWNQLFALYARKLAS
jgi:dienelactone hydrolase